MPAARPPPSAPPVRTQPQPPPEGPQVDAPVPAPPPAASSTGRKTAKKRKPAGEAGAALARIHACSEGDPRLRSSTGHGAVAATLT